MRSMFILMFALGGLLYLIGNILTIIWSGDPPGAFSYWWIIALFILAPVSIIVAIWIYVLGDLDLKKPSKMMCDNCGEAIGILRKLYRKVTCFSCACVGLGGDGKYGEAFTAYEVRRYRFLTSSRRINKIMEELNERKPM